MTSLQDARAEAVALDDADELRAFHDRFVVADDGLIYLDGNSLGRLPRDTAARLAEVVQGQWGERLIRAWSEGWMELPRTLGDRLGAELLGAAAGQVAIADSTTVCFYKLAAAALSARPGRTQIITDVDNFPTDRYVLESLASERGLEILWVTADPDAGPEPSHVEELISERTALVTFSHVNYRSAFILDARAITSLAHEAGALALWDLSHSAGAIPVDLDGDGVDLAVGCTYKYLNGGPGAPAYLYVRAEHQGALRQPIWGWLGRQDPFEMAPGYLPGEGISAMLSGTPPVLALTAVARRAGSGGRGRDRRHPPQVDRAHRVRDRAHRRLAGAAGLLGGLAARGEPARVTRRARAPRGTDALAAAHRRRRGRGLPHAGRHPAGPLTADHPLHRRPRRPRAGAPDAQQLSPAAVSARRPEAVAAPCSRVRIAVWARPKAFSSFSSCHSELASEPTASSSKASCSGSVPALS